MVESRNKEFVAFMAKMSYNRPPVMNMPGELRYGNEMSPVAPHIVLGVSCATRISHQLHFIGNYRLLVMFQGDSCCSACCTGLFMCDEDQS